MLIKKISIGLFTGLVHESNHTKCVSLSDQKSMIQTILINLYPNEYSQKDFTTIHSQLNQIDVLEVAILWMIYLIKYVFQIKWKI